MRPIVALAILLLGLTAALSEVKFGTTAAVQALAAKMQDRVPAVDEAQPPADTETTGSIGKSDIGNVAIRVAAVGDIDIVRSQMTAPETGTPEIKKTDNVLALLTPPTVGPPDAANQPPPAATNADVDAEADATVADSVDALCSALITSAQDNDLPVQFFANLIWQESRLQRDSISKAGALGIAQFMPEVAEEVGLADPFDPRQAIPASARLLKVLRQHFGNLGYVAAAYNAGAGRVGRWLDRHRPLPRETRTYVLRVTGRTAEAWRKSQPADSKLRFASSLPCRNLPAFAELEQAQLNEVEQGNDGKDAQPQQEKIASRVAHLIARKVAVKVVAKQAAKAAVKAAAKAAQPVTTVGSVVMPRTVEAKDATKAAGPAHGKMAKTKVAAKTATQPITTANAGSGSVTQPLAGQAKPAAKPAAAATPAAHVIARNVHPRRDALHRPQPVSHEKRRVA
jgi:Transglycosylase SLT domain